MTAVLPQHILDQLTKSTRSTTTGDDSDDDDEFVRKQIPQQQEKKKVSARDEGLSMLLSELQESAPNLHPLVNENSLRKTAAATAA